MLARNWSPEIRSASASSSAANPRLLVGRSSRPSAGRAARYGRERHRADAARPSVFWAMPIATSHLTARSILPGSFGRLTLMRAGEHAVRPLQRILEEVGRGGRSRRRCRGRRPAGRSASGSASAGSRRSTLSALSMPMRFGSRYAPPQPGMMPRNTSGSANAGTGGVDRAVGRVQPDLDAAAERQPVDEARTTGRRARRAAAERAWPSCGHRVATSRLGTARPPGRGPRPRRG